MPKDVSSPFTPGIPVPVDFFVGRRAEIEHLNRKVTKAAQSGRPEVVFLMGERGIGKSSLASFVRVFSERRSNALAVHALLSGAKTLEEMAGLVFDRILKRAARASWFERVKELFGKHIKKAGLFNISVEFSAPEQDLKRLVANFSEALRSILDRIKDERKVMLLILDDINGLAVLPEFANWLKSLVDEIGVSQEPLPLCIVLVGVEERRKALIDLQPSLDRVLDIVEIKPWSSDEAKDFYTNTFSKVGIRLEPNALEAMTHYAGGLPVLAHEIGDAAFNLDMDDVIDRNDAYAAITTAADIIGRKYLQPKIMDGLKSTRYRKILKQVASTPFSYHFTRAEILQHLPHDEGNVLDNFLRRMCDLGVVSKDPERGAGAYTFTNVLHHVYFWMQATSVQGMSADDDPTQAGTSESHSNSRP